MGRFKRNGNNGGKNVTKNLMGKNGGGRLPSQFKHGLYTMNDRGQLELLAVNPPSVIKKDPIELIKKHEAMAKCAYNEKVHPMVAYDLCWRYNYTLSKLTKIFGVAGESTHYWYRNYPEFQNAVDSGREAYRIEHLEEALIKKATGYQYETVRVEEVLVPTHLPLGGVVEVPAAKKTVTTKQVQPSQNALEFALTNLKKSKWQPPQQNVKVDSTTETKSQTIDWNKALDKIGVEGVKQLVGTLKQISAEPAPE